MKRRVLLAMVVGLLAAALPVLSGQPAWAAIPAPTVTSTDYPDDGLAHGGVGVVGSFTFSSGDPSVIGFRWSLTDPPSTFVPTAAGEPRTIELAPPRFGLNFLFVRAESAAGASPTTTYTFIVDGPDAPVARWSLEAFTGFPGEEFADQAGDDDPLTPSLGLTMQADARHIGTPVAAFDGSSASAQTAGPVVDTGTSFAVAAWARLTDRSARRTVLSQEGTRGVGFALAYASAADRWVVEMYSADVDNPVITRAVSSAAPRLGFWTHLAAEYDADDGQLRLYVNGALTGSAAHVSSWSATGPMVVGRARVAGQAARFWAGNIADVFVWDRALVDEDLPEIRQPNQVGSWLINGDCCGEALDGAFWNRSLFLTPVGASFLPDRRDDVLQFDGTSGAAATTGPVLRTDQSFTVASWVRLDALPADARCAASQDGLAGSGFCLGLSGRRWAISARSADNSGSGHVAAARSATPLTPADIGTWVHLTGVYDTAARQLRLYVNGQLVASAGRSAAWQAGGSFVTGRGLRNAAPAHYWPGAVDEVQVYAGVLSDDRIQQLPTL